MWTDWLERILRPRERSDDTAGVEAVLVEADTAGHSRRLDRPRADVKPSAPKRVEETLWC